MFKKWLSTLSLTKRLLLGALLWVLCSLVAAGVLLNQLFQQHVEQQLNKELSVHLLQLITQLSIEDNQLHLSQPLSDPRFNQPLGGLYWQIQSTGPTSASLHSRSLWDESLQPPRAQMGKDTWFRYIDPDLGELYVVGRSITLADTENDQPLQFWVAAQKELIAEPLQRFVWMLVLTLALLGSVLVAGVWWQLRLGLRPLRQLRRRLSAVHEGHSAYIDGQYPQEIQPLVSEFNRVLQSNAQVVERARTQAGNLAHAIKTPLAVLANAAKQNDESLADLVIEQVAGAQQQVDYHLSRARVAAAVKTVGVRTPVVPAVQSLTKWLQRAYASKSVDLKVSSDQVDLYFKGEAQDLHELLGNVLDNAFKWCSTQIQVTVRRVEAINSPSVLVIQVDDDGAGLSPEKYTQIFKRGMRADEIAPGSGLGLSIVDELVQLYGGDVSATRSPLGGLRVQIRLP